MRHLKTSVFCLVIISCILCVTNFTQAQQPKPVAIRFWGQSMISIETYWNLKVVIDPYALNIGYGNPAVQADLVLVTHEHMDHNNVSMVNGTPQVVKGLDKAGAVIAKNFILERKENSTNVTLSDFDESKFYSEHAIHIQTIASHHDTNGGKERGQNAMFLIETNGLRILHCGDLGQTELTDAQLNQIGMLDVLIIPVGGVYTIDALQAVGIINQLEPRFVLPVHYKTKQLTIKLNTVEPFLESCPKKYQRVRPVGNTFAVLQNPDPAFEKKKLVVLNTRSWEMPLEMIQLFIAKENSARSVQSSYSGLSANQLNHRPSNGTHTPRWNAEHIMGRELLFFSTIYSHLNPMIFPIDLNPAQTPPEYHAANPNWNGEEEARQIERTQAFTRRFAYLLHGIDLDTKPKGSPWALGELLTRMADHYHHHTDNLPAKFKLPDWPQN